ncbi:hypothetical protein IMZ48_49730, partial [Candidatus Bathyarchaeota archaeon]|nr:hypothetical protein [Candidatus Bathyarchaeota archaeon]
MAYASHHGMLVESGKHAQLMGEPGPQRHWRRPADSRRGNPAQRKATSEGSQWFKMRATRNSSKLLAESRVDKALRQLLAAEFKESFPCGSERPLLPSQTTTLPGSTQVPPPRNYVSIFNNTRNFAGADVMNHLKVQLLCRAYQARGHHKANIDPLGIRGSSKGFGNVKPRKLTLEYYNFSRKDLDSEFELRPGILLLYGDNQSPQNQYKGFSNVKPRELTLEYYNFSEKDLDSEFELSPGILPRFIPGIAPGSLIGYIGDQLKRITAKSWKKCNLYRQKHPWTGS